MKDGERFIHLNLVTFLSKEMLSLQLVFMVAADKIDQNFGLKTYLPRSNTQKTMAVKRLV